MNVFDENTITMGTDEASDAMTASVETPKTERVVVREVHQKRNKPYVDVPIHTRRKSKRYETIGLIMRIVDLAGFELADRIVLRDKVTGEILK